MTDNPTSGQRRWSGARLLGEILASGKADSAIELAIARVLVSENGSVFRAPDFVTQFAQEEQAVEAIRRGDEAWRAVGDAFSDLERVCDDLAVQRREMLADSSMTRGERRIALRELEAMSGAAVGRLRLAQALQELAEVYEMHPRARHSG
jgi:hypothetical protein